MSFSEKDRKYVYFKNQITDKLAGKAILVDEGFYPSTDSEDFDGSGDFYVDEIAYEPSEVFLKEPSGKSKFTDRLKSAVSSIKIPDINVRMPDF